MTVHTSTWFFSLRLANPAWTLELLATATAGACFVNLDNVRAVATPGLERRIIGALGYALEIDQLRGG
ncbi:MAG: hypothetical protein JNJ54_31055 [Myxococcaceae bacterium]|nr:hypothetical protein [Myxococcaceae bacterium]